MGGAAWPGLPIIRAVPGRAGTAPALPMQMQEESASQQTLHHPPSLQRPHALPEALCRLRETQNHKGGCSATRAGAVSWPKGLLPSAGWEVALCTSAALQPFPSHAAWWELGSSWHLPHCDLSLGRADTLLLWHKSCLLCPQDVGYPEFLNIRPYMSQKNGDPVVYGLYAVLVHSGFSCHAGHYYCYVKVSPGHCAGPLSGLGAGGCSWVPAACRKEGAQ